MDHLKYNEKDLMIYGKIEHHIIGPVKDDKKENMKTETEAEVGQWCEAYL